jgi:6-pyruvoyl-tetrahydropterin synthase
MTYYIGVKHNIEVAHRLFETQGKCEAIHGHSMMVELAIYGEKDDHGLLGGIEFGALKKEFRAYLDDEYDHHLILNLSDPFARPLFLMERDDSGEFTTTSEQAFLPGLNAMPGDPTTENIAAWIFDWASDLEMIKDNVMVESIMVEVKETATNFAGRLIS